jgi:uncharacterized protein (DUF2141 family)
MMLSTPVQHIGLAFLFLLLLSAPIARSEPLPKPSRDCGELTVVVTGAATESGKIIIALCADGNQWANNTRPFRSAAVSLRNGGAEYVFSDMPLGTYAIKAFHDENGNGTMDKNALGMPIELYGFSNGARARYGAPSFQSACFRLTKTREKIEIRIE